MQITMEKSKHPSFEYVWKTGERKKAGRLLPALGLFASLSLFLVILLRHGMGFDLLEYIFLLFSMLMGLRFLLPALQCVRKIFSDLYVIADENGLDIDSADRLVIGWEEVEEVARLEFDVWWLENPLNRILFDIRHLGFGPAVVLDVCERGQWYALKTGKGRGWDIFRWYRPGFYYFKIAENKKGKFERVVRHFGKYGGRMKSFEEFLEWAEG
ncbi:MAG: hypothetical protein ABIH83_03185 [Candidatus Micrarchaeota archaeon]